MTSNFLVEPLFWADCTLGAIILALILLITFTAYWHRRFGLSKDSIQELKDLVVYGSVVLTSFLLGLGVALTTSMAIMISTSVALGSLRMVDFASKRTVAEVLTLIAMIVLIAGWLLDRQNVAIRASLLALCGPSAFFLIRGLLQIRKWRTAK